MPQGWTAYQVVIFLLACWTDIFLLSLHSLTTCLLSTLLSSLHLCTRSVGGWASGHCPSGWSLHTSDPESTRYQHNKTLSSEVLFFEYSQTITMAISFNQLTMKTGIISHVCPQLRSIPILLSKLPVKNNLSAFCHCMDFCCSTSSLMNSLRQKVLQKYVCWDVIDKNTLNNYNIMSIKHTSECSTTHHNEDNGSEWRKKK